MGETIFTSTLSNFFPVNYRAVGAFCYIQKLYVYVQLFSNFRHVSKGIFLRNYLRHVSKGISKGIFFFLEIIVVRSQVCFADL